MTIRVNNSDLGRAFVMGETDAKGSNMFIEGDIIYSYGHHFPIGLRLRKGFIVNVDRYSTTTSCHIGRVLGAIGYNDVIETTTEGIEEAIKLFREGKKTTIEDFR